MSLGKSIVRYIHKSSVLRSFAKHALRNVTLYQKFYNGKLAINAVDQAWGWTGERSYESHDQKLHDCLLTLSNEAAHFIDVGCNIGTMAFSVLFRNPKITATCVDPNQKAIDLVRKTVVANELEDRVGIHWAAVGEVDGAVRFNEAGSVVGHVSEFGVERECLSFSNLINEHNSDANLLVKVDIEGFETKILKTLREVENLSTVVMVLEVHPKDFNGLGDPAYCFSILKEHKAQIQSLSGEPLAGFEECFINHVVVRFGK